AVGGERWVLGGGPGCSDRVTILRACHAAGFEPRVGVEFPTDDYHATQGMVAPGAGITLLPRLALSVPRSPRVGSASPPPTPPPPRGWSRPGPGSPSCPAWPSPCPATTWWSAPWPAAACPARGGGPARVATGPS